MSQPQGDVTSCLEHPGTASLEKGIFWAPAERLPWPSGGDARPDCPLRHTQRPLQWGLAAGLLPWAWLKT